MKYLKDQKRLESGGFRIAWFIPIEMLLSGAMLGLAPRIGLGSSIALIGIPSAIILFKISRLQDRLSERYIEPDWRIMKTLTPQENLAYWDGDDFDFTKPNWYADRVMGEIIEILNPLRPIKKLAHKLSKIKLPKLSLHLPKRIFFSKI